MSSRDNYIGGSQEKTFHYTEIEKLAEILECYPAELIRKSSEKTSKTIISPEPGLPVRRTKKPHNLTMLEEADVMELYSQQGLGHFVGVFSCDGFLEARNDQRALRNAVFKAVDSGLEMLYFFPQGLMSDKSMMDFEFIQKQYNSDIDAFAKAQKDPIGILDGFLLSEEGDLLYAKSSRFVFFGSKSAKKREIRRIFLYVHSGDNYWIEMTNISARNFISTISASVDPIPHISNNDKRNGWKIPTHIKNSYRNSFGGDGKFFTYKEIRSLGHTTLSSESFADEIRENLPIDLINSKKPFFDWLDIGSESGANTNVLHSKFKENNLNLSLTAIEPAFQSHPHDVLLNSSRFFNGELTIEDYITIYKNSKKFDIITSIHSWYVIDPAVLLNAYRLLSEFGVMGIVISPLADNIINEIVFHVDRYIMNKQKIDGFNEMKGKVIWRDSLKNYGEDIVSMCQRFFGLQNVIVREHQYTIPRNDILGNEQLTDLGRKLVTFFLHNITSADEELFSHIFDKLNLKFKHGDLPCKQFHIIVSRYRIRKDYDKVMNFEYHRSL